MMYQYFIIMTRFAVIQLYPCLAIGADSQNDTDKNMISEAMLFKYAWSLMSTVMLMSD